MSFDHFSLDTTTEQPTVEPWYAHRQASGMVQDDNRAYLPYATALEDFAPDFPLLPESIASQRPVENLEKPRETPKVVNFSNASSQVANSFVSRSSFLSPTTVYASKSKETGSRQIYDLPKFYETAGLTSLQIFPEADVLENPSEVSEEVDSGCSEAVVKRIYRESDEQRCMLKQKIRRENNRAAARRSNLKKKIEKEAQKRELAIMQQMESELRAKDLQLRQENLWLRSLVYPKGHKY